MNRISPATACLRPRTWQFGLSGEYSFPISGRLGITARADYKWQNDIYFDLFNNPLNTQHAYGLLNGSALDRDARREWSLAAFARNAFDKRYVSQSLTAASDTVPARVGQLGTPREYGVASELSLLTNDAER